MDAAIKKKWIEALKSGTYQQGTGSLKALNNHGQITYCCLGVLCEITDKFKTATHFYTQDPSYVGDTFSVESYFAGTADGPSNHEILTNPLLEEFGIERETMNALTNMNDNRGKSFDQIAKYIEESL